MYFYLPNLLNLLFGGTRKARSIETLARKIDISPQVLAQTIAVYNSDAAGGLDPLGKSADKVRPVAQGPLLRRQHVDQESIWLHHDHVFGGP